MILSDDDIRFLEIASISLEYGISFKDAEIVYQNILNDDTSYNFIDIPDELIEE